MVKDEMKQKSLGENEAESWQYDTENQTTRYTRHKTKTNKAKKNIKNKI